MTRYLHLAIASAVVIAGIMAWVILGGCAPVYGAERKTLGYLGVCAKECRGASILSTPGGFDTISTVGTYYTAVSEIRQYATFEEMTNGPWHGCIPSEHYRIDLLPDGSVKILRLKHKMVTEEHIQTIKSEKRVLIDEVME